MESGDDDQIFASFGMDVDGVVRHAEELLSRKRLRN